MIESGSRFQVRLGSRTIAGLVAVKIKFWITLSILCFVNLVYFMDRYSLIAAFDDIAIYYNNHADHSGLMSIVYTILYTAASLSLGYLGDRYNRKFTMAAGTLFWSVAAMTSSFMTNFYSFKFFRALAGVGETSYSIVCPAIICDMFINELRCDMLALFFFMSPVGSGLGLLLGAEMLKAFGVWQWGLRVTSLFGVLSGVLVLFAMHDPARGEAEFPNGSPHATSWTVDLKSLFKNVSFLLATAGFTCAAFVAAAIMSWYPVYLYNREADETSPKTVSEQFDSVVVVSGLVGVPVGLILAATLRHICSSVAPLICGTGLLLATPILYLSFAVADSMSLWWCYSLMFIVGVALHTTWLVVSDMTLYVIIPTRRVTAAAIQYLFSQVLGFVLSPHVLSALRNAIRKYSMPPKPDTDFLSLQYALYSVCVVQVFAGVLFLFIVKYIVKDNEIALSTYSQESSQNL